MRKRLYVSIYANMWLVEKITIANIRDYMFVYVENNKDD
jgi:hypothetical protein